MIVKIGDVPVEIQFPKWVRYSEQIEVLDVIEGRANLLDQIEQLKKKITKMETADGSVSAPQYP